MSGKTAYLCRFFVYIVEIVIQGLRGVGKLGVTEKFPHFSDNTLSMVAGEQRAIDDGLYLYARVCARIYQEFCVFSVTSVTGLRNQGEHSLQLCSTFSGKRGTFSEKYRTFSRKQGMFSRK